MHIEFKDIISRIPETPRWWLDGTPRFDPFRPGDLDVYAREALLVHAQCQACGVDFHVGLWNPSIVASRNFRLHLTQHRHIALGDPPNVCCGVGASMTMVEQAILEFWERNERTKHNWTRVPELERGLWKSEIEEEENHQEAWRRIHLYDARQPGNRPSWLRLPEPPEFAPGLPSLAIVHSSASGKSVDRRKLNAQRRLALMAWNGKISEDEYSQLREADQRTFSEFEARPAGPRPVWAERIAEDVREIDDAIIGEGVQGYETMSRAEREVIYCNGLHRRLAPLTREGKITHREYRELLPLMMRKRYQQ